MNKQPGSTLSTTLNGSRSCYITTKSIELLSVETILARTIHISNTILNCFRTLFKNVNPWTKRKKKRRKKNVFDLQKNIAHLAHRRALRTLIIASAERLKSLFVQAKFTQTLCVWAIHVPNENNSAFVIPTIRAESATHCNCSQKHHTCKQQKINSC